MRAVTPPLPLFAYGTLTDEGLVAGLLERPVRGEPEDAFVYLVTERTLRRYLR